MSKRDMVYAHFDLGTDVNEEFMHRFVGLVMRRDDELVGGLSKLSRTQRLAVATRQPGEMVTRMLEEGFSPVRIEVEPETRT